MNSRASHRDIIILIAPNSFNLPSYTATRTIPVFDGVTGALNTLNELTCLQCFTGKFIDVGWPVKFGLDEARHMLCPFLREISRYVRSDPGTGQKFVYFRSCLGRLSRSWPPDVVDYDGIQAVIKRNIWTFSSVHGMEQHLRSSCKSGPRSRSGRLQQPYQEINLNVLWCLTRPS